MLNTFEYYKQKQSLQRPEHVSPEDWDFFQANKNNFSKLTAGDKRKMIFIIRFGFSREPTDREVMHWIFNDPQWHPSRWPLFGRPLKTLSN